MNKVQLVDVCSVFFRFYFSSAPEKLNDDGWDISALLAMTRWLCKKELLDADSVVLAFDESLGTGFRHQIDENYKAHRPLPTEDIIYQLTLLKSIGEFLGFVVLASDKYEADDLLASACGKLPASSCLIYSRDKDLRQLLNDNVSVLDFVTDTLWTPEYLHEQTGLKPHQIPLYLALVGDASDNIPGVSGVGDITARRILKAFTDWPELINSLLSDTPLNMRGEARIRRNIIASQALVRRNLQLTELKLNAPVVLKSTPLNEESWKILNALLEKINLKKPLKKSLELVSGYVI
ncbi:MAG: 5'-3' exonuclease H3TH domain-containing protein [Bermanella sp.]